MAAFAGEVLRHVVLLKIKDDASPDAVAALIAETPNLASIDGVLSAVCGPSFTR